MRETGPQGQQPGFTVGRRGLAAVTLLGQTLNLQAPGSSWTPGSLPRPFLRAETELLPGLA